MIYLSLIFPDIYIHPLYTDILTIKYRLTGLWGWFIVWNVTKPVKCYDICI